MKELENEIWKPTKVNPYYLVSNKGRIKTLDRPIWCRQNNSYSIRKGIVMTPNKTNSKHYWRVSIPSESGNKESRKMYAVHRLVAEAFLPNPQNLPQINHIDGNKDNNCVENLEWCDNGYNQRHALSTGLKDRSKMSANSSFRKLSEEQIRFIKHLYSSVNTDIRGQKWFFCRVIKQLFNLQSENTVLWIVNEGTNKFIDQTITQNSTFTDWLSKYEELCTKMKPKKTIKSYADELGINESSFRTRFEMFNRDIGATVNYYKQLHNTIN